MYKKIFILIIIIFSIVNFSNAANFETMGIGARPLGMGGAFTAIADDANAIYYNQAGLPNIKYNQFTTMYYDMYGEGLIGNTFLGLAAPYVGPGTFGLSWHRVGVNSDFMLKGFSENVITSAYGLNIIPGINAGFALKFLGAFYGRIKGLGYGVDLSGYYNYDDFLYIGMIFQNFNKPKIRWDTLLEEDMDSNLRLGFGLTPVPYLIFGLDIDQLTYDRKNIHIGAEVTPFKSGIVDFRGGLIKIAEEKLSYTLGASLHISRLRVDYAAHKHANLGYSNILGLTFEF